MYFHAIPAACATTYFPLKCVSDTVLSLGSALLVGFVVLLAVRYAKSPWRNVPPGPKGLPIIGHAHLFSDKTWMFQQNCKQRFGGSDFFVPRGISRGLAMLIGDTSGDFIYLNAFGQPILILQSLKPAFELLDKRANISSDRPRYIVVHEILCGGLFTASMLYGDLSVPSFLLVGLG